MKQTDKITVKRTADSEKHEIVVEYDFEGVTEEQKLDLMMRSAKIAHQARLRKLGESELARMAEAELNVCMVKELFDRAPSVVDPLKTVEKLDAAGLAKLIAAAQAMLESKK